MASGTLLGFQNGTTSSADFPPEPAGWVCLLQSLSGRPLRLRIGNRSFRLSSDTVFFLEEVASRGEPKEVGGPQGNAVDQNSFIYVCGTPESLVKTLRDLGKVSGGCRFFSEDPEALRGLGN